MPKQKLEDMTLLEKADLIQKLSIFPAITAMVFIRRKVGYRMLKPTWLITLTIVMLIVPALFSAFAGPVRFLMPLYAFSMLGLGLWQRSQRWTELCANVHWYTLCPGISYLDSLPLPSFLRSHYRINRWVDPAAVAIAGALTALLLSRGLGLWILFSAFSLYVYEQAVYDRSVNRDLDTLDGMCMSEAQAELTRIFGGKTGESLAQSEMNGESKIPVGVPTGLAPDLCIQVLQINFFGGQKPNQTQLDNIVPQLGDIAV